MQMLEKNLISANTQTRLLTHGLTLTAKPYDIVDMSHDNCVIALGGVNNDFTGNEQDISDKDGVSSFATELLHTHHGAFFDSMEIGAISYPVYDIGENDFNFTTHTNIHGNTGWVNFSGIIFADLGVIFKEMGIVDLEHEHEAIIRAGFERKLQELSASYNNDVFTIEVKTLGDTPISVTHNGCYNIGDEIDIQVNAMIDEIVAEIDKTGNDIMLQVSPSLIGIGIKPAQYVAKQIYHKFGMRVALGSSTYHEKHNWLNIRIRPDLISAHDDLPADETPHSTISTIMSGIKGIEF